MVIESGRLLVGARGGSRGNSGSVQTAGATQAIQGALSAGLAVQDVDGEGADQEDGSDPHRELVDALCLDAEGLLARHTEGITEALVKIYEATRIVDELMSSSR